MEIDQLTIAQAREIAGMFAPAPAAPAPALAPLAARYIGRYVVVRSHLSGVWMGLLLGAHADGGLVLGSARRAWYWEGAGSCSGLALRGEIVDVEPWTDGDGRDGRDGRGDRYGDRYGGSGHGSGYGHGGGAGHGGGYGSGCGDSDGFGDGYGHGSGAGSGYGSGSSSGEGV